jgi:hypothetical protein
VNRITRDFVAPVLAIIVSVGLLLGAIGWLIARAPSRIEISPSLRLVAFAMAAMGVAWLVAPFLVAWASRPCPATLADEKNQSLGHGQDARATVWPALFRWAAVIDTAGVAIVIASVVSDAVSWRQGLMLYAILASFALLQLAAMCVTLRISRSAGLAIMVGVAIMVVGCTSLAWGHLLDRPFATGTPADRAVLAVVQYANPLLSAHDAVAFDWAHHGQMYAHYGIIGESRVLGLPDWRIACGWYLAIAAALGLLARVCRRVQTARKVAP